MDIQLLLKQAKLSAYAKGIKDGAECERERAEKLVEGLEKIKKSSCCNVCECLSCLAKDILEKYRS